MRTPTAGDLATARARVARRLAPTPLVASTWLSEAAGVPVWLKLESLQPTRSFKIRGAINAVDELLDTTRDASPAARGALRLVTASAGNHGAALAWAAARAGLPCTVVTPASAPQAKLDAIRRLGADLRAVATDYDDAERRALALTRDEGATFVSPYNDTAVIAGAATVGLEILEQLPDSALLVVPLGGGGLYSGVALSVAGRTPPVALAGIEAERSPAFTRSLAAGRIVPIEVGDTLADGLAGNLEPGSVTFDIVRSHGLRVVALPESAVVAGVVDLVREQRLVAEGAGAMAVAAVAGRHVRSARGPIVAIVSGANLDVARLASLLAPPPR